MNRFLPSGARILALDLHPRRYGYVVLETPAELLDWGIRRRYCKRRNSGDFSLNRGLRSLLQMWQPSLALIKEPSRHVAARTRKRLAKLVAEIRHFCIPVRYVSEEAIRNSFSNGHPEVRPTKYAVAAALAQQFPFLAHSLPPSRKIWQSEDYRMGIFAAIAVALTANNSRK